MFEAFKQSSHLAVVLANKLRLVNFCGYGEMQWQDGEGVNQQLEIVIDGYLRLNRWPVLLTQEAGTLRQGGFINLCACRN